MCLNLGPTPRHQQKVPALPPSPGCSQTHPEPHQCCEQQGAAPSCLGTAAAAAPGCQCSTRAAKQKVSRAQPRGWKSSPGPSAGTRQTAPTTQLCRRRLGDQSQEEPGTGFWVSLQGWKLSRIFFCLLFFNPFFFFPHEQLLDINPLSIFPLAAKQRDIYSGHMTPWPDTATATYPHYHDSGSTAEPLPQQHLLPQLCVSSLGYPVLQHLRAQGM